MAANFSKNYPYAYYEVPAFVEKISVDWSKGSDWSVILPKAPAKTHTLVGGQVLKNVHAETPECHELGCSIHHPTDPRSDWPQKWSAGHMWRVCPCGVGHLDQDHINWLWRVEAAEYVQALVDDVALEAQHCCGYQPFDGYANDLAKAFGVL